MILLDTAKELPHVRLVRVDPHLLAEFLKQGNRINVLVEEGVPIDAVCEGTALDASSGAIVIYLSHPSFDEVPYQSIIPEQRVVLKKMVD